MASNSDLESITFSDVDGDLLGEENSDEEEDSESDDSSDVANVVEEPKVTSMAARMAAARAARAKTATRASEKPGAAKGTVKESAARKPSKPEQPKKAPETTAKRGPGRPKKTPVASKAPPAKEPARPKTQEAVGIMPPPLPVQEREEESSDSSDSDSSSDDDDDMENVRPFQPASNASPKQKVVPEGRPAQGKQPQSHSESDDELDSDDKPLKQPAGDMDVTIKPQKRAMHVAKSADGSKETNPEVLTAKKLESSRGTRANGMSQTLGKQAVKKLRQSTRPPKVKSSAVDSVITDGINSATRVPNPEKEQYRKDESTETHGPDEPQVAHLTMQPKSSRSRKGPGGRAVRANEGLAKDNATAHHDDSIGGKEKGEVKQREVGGTSKLSVQKKPTAGKRTSKRDSHHKSNVAGGRDDENSAGEQERAQSKGKRPGTSATKRNSEAKTEQVQGHPDVLKQDGLDPRKGKADEGGGKKNASLLPKQGNTRKETKARRAKPSDGAGSKKGEGTSQKEVKGTNQEPDSFDRDRMIRDEDGSTGMARKIELESRLSIQREGKQGKHGQKSDASRSNVMSETVEKRGSSGSDVEVIEVNEEGSSALARERMRPNEPGSKSEAVRDAHSEPPAQPDLKNNRSRASTAKRKRITSMGRSTTGKWISRKAVKTGTGSASVTSGERPVDGYHPDKTNGKVLPIDTDVDITFTAPVTSGNESLLNASQIAERIDDEVIDVPDESLENLADSRVDEVMTDAPSEGLPAGSDDVNADNAAVLAHGSKVHHSETRQHSDTPQEEKTFVPVPERREKLTGNRSPGDGTSIRNMKPLREKVDSRAIPNMRADNRDVTEAECLHGATGGAHETMLGLHEANLTTASRDTAATGLQSPTKQAPTDMSDKDEPFQAMMLCQQLQRSFWDFADTQDTMIDGFLGLLRKRSTINRSRTGSEWPQAWASPDERQYLRRQNWYAEVNLARLELRRVQEQALEAFAKRVSAAQKSDVNTLGDFFIDHHRSHVPEMDGQDYLPRRASESIAFPRTDNFPEGLHGSIGENTPIGNVRFSLPVGTVPSSIAKQRASLYAQTPPGFASLEHASQAQKHTGVDYNQPTSGRTSIPDNSAMRVPPPDINRQMSPTDLNQAFWMENYATIIGDDKLHGPPMTSSRPKHDRAIPPVTAPAKNMKASVQTATPFPRSAPVSPTTQSGVQVADAKSRGKVESTKDAQFHDKDVPDAGVRARAAELANGMLKAAANKTTPGSPQHGGNHTTRHGSDRVGKQANMGEPEVVAPKKLLDNGEVQDWVGDAFSELHLDCFRSRAILKMCSRPGGLPLSELVDLLPFGKTTLRGRLKLLVSKGYLVETQVKDVTKPGLSKPTRVYTTAEGITDPS